MITIKACSRFAWQKDCTNQFPSFPRILLKIYYHSLYPGYIVYCSHTHQYGEFFMAFIRYKSWMSGINLPGDYYFPFLSKTQLN